MANATDDRAILEAQQRAITHLAQRLDITPRVLSAVNGRALAEAMADDGKRHLVWAITWIDGTPMAAVPRRSRELDEDFGRQVGALRRELADFDHPAFHRDFYWDLAKGRAIVDAKRTLIKDAALGAVIDRVIGEIDRRTVPLLDGLRRGMSTVI